MRIKMDCFSGALAVLIGIVFIFPSLTLGVSSLTSDGVPGPGFFPFFIAAAVIGLGLLLIFKGLLQKEESGHMTVTTGENRKNILVTISAFIAYLGIWRISDFFLASALLALFLNYFYKRSLKFNIVYTVVFIAMIYLVFYRFLRIYFVI